MCTANRRHCLKKPLLFWLAITYTWTQFWLLHYLAKQKTQKLSFTWMLYVALPANTKCIQVITWSQLNHPSFTCTKSFTCTQQNLRIAHCMLSSVTIQSSLPRLWWCRSLCQKWDFFVEPGVNQWSVLVGCLAISTNASCYQTHYGCGNFVFQQGSEHWAATQFNSTAMQNFHLHFS